MSLLGRLRLPRAARPLLPALDLSSHESTSGVTPRRQPPDEWLADVLARWGVAAEDAVVLRRYDGRRVARATAPDGSTVVLRTYPSPRDPVAESLFGPGALRDTGLWATAMSDAGLTVPRPLPALDGATVVAVPPDPLQDGRRGVSAPGAAVLVTWVAGEVVGPSATDPEAAAAVGRLLGRLHAHAARWPTPPQWRRPVWGPPHTFRPRARVWRQEDPVGPATVRLLRELARVTRLRLGPGTGGPSGSQAHVGVVHRDLAPENVVHHAGEAHPIDLDGCGTGSFHYDTALPLLRLAGAPDARDLHRELLAGYAQVRPLPRGTDDLLRLAVAVRLVDRLDSTLRHRRPGTRLLGERQQAHAEETVRALHAVCAAAGLRP